MNSPARRSDLLPLPGGLRELSARALIDALHAMRDAPRHEAYWADLATGLQRLTRAQGAWLLLQAPAGWQLIGHAGSEEDPLDAGFAAELAALTQRAQTQGFASCPGRSAQGAALWWAAVRLERIAGGWLLLAIPEHERPQLNELLLRAQLVADLPTLTPQADAAPAGASPPGGTPPSSPTSDDGGDWARLADLCAEVGRADRFGVAALTLVNALAAQFGAMQVVLGWRARTDAGMQVAAISHRDRFDDFSHPIALTADALDEALDHADGVRLDAQAGPAAAAFPAHEQLQRSLGPVHLWTLPIRRDDEPPRAVLLLAFEADPPRAALAPLIVRAMQLLMPWLRALQARERAWPLRLADQVRDRLAQWLGPGRSGLKAAALVVSAALLYALVAKWDYRVSANGQLATDSTRIVSAQFDGRIEEARVTAGDSVQADQILAVFDTRELQQQETDARAELKRFNAEADKARAASALAELEVASARAAQSQARLSRVLDQLAQAQHRAPFDGVVVEGERKELQGAPARKGDRLYRLARVEGLYATLQVNERDAAQVRPGATGELALVSRPDQRIPLRVLAVIPVAQTRGAEGNQFLVRAELLQAAEPWWRPGMSGSARIDAGERQVAWILTHRLIDTLRLAWWW